MRRPPLLTSSLATVLLLAACAEKINVGDARDTRNLGDDIALAQLAADLAGLWYSNLPELEMSTQFIPYGEGRRAGRFSVSCRSEACPVGDFFISFFGEPAPVEGTAQPDRFAVGEYQLVELLSDADEDSDSGIRAKCVMIPDIQTATLAAPSATMEIELRPEDEVLRVSMNNASFDYTREEPE